MTPLRDIYDQVDRINLDGEGPEAYVWNVPIAVDSDGRILELLVQVEDFRVEFRSDLGKVVALCTYPGLPTSSTLRFLAEIDRRTAGTLVEAFRGRRDDIANELAVLRRLPEDGPLTIQPTTFLTWEEDIFPFPPSQHRRT